MPKDSTPIKASQLVSRMHERMRHQRQRLPWRCLALSDSGESCSNPPIKTHTLAKSVFLKKLAESGHVYSYSPLFNRHGDDLSVVTPEKRGIGTASTFPGFCENHDNQLFSVVERERFENTPQQVFMLAYRALCYELHVKEFICHPKVRYEREKLENKLPKHVRERAAKIRAMQVAGSASGLRDLRAHKKAYDNSLLRKGFADVASYTMEFSGDPVLMCCSGATPSYDFSGRFMQNMQQDSTFGKLVTITAFSDRPGRWFAVLAWQRESDAIGRQLIGSLREQSNMAASLASLVFAHCGNLHFRMSWWDNLSADTRRALMSFFTMTAVTASVGADLQQRILVPTWDLVRVWSPPDG